MLKLSKADCLRIEMLIRGLVSIGKDVPFASRPYYVAWLYHLAAFGDDVLLRIGRPLGVNELSHEAAQFSAWVAACEIGDLKTCAVIERQLEEAGAIADAMAIFDSTRLAAQLVSATLPTMDYFNQDEMGASCL